MTSDAGTATGQERDELGDLRRHTQELAGQLPGRLRRIRLTSGDLTVEAEWAPDPAGGGDAAAGHPTVPPTAVGELSSGPGGPGPGSPGPGGRDSADGESADRDSPDTVPVTSPMVGTFYRAPEPGAAPFVAVGDLVERGQTLAIVEAMKLMNPLAAEMAGRVAELHVEDGQPVEFGQVLLTLEPVA